MKIFDATKLCPRTRNLTVIVSDCGEDIVKGKHLPVINHISPRAKYAATLCDVFICVVIVGLLPSEILSVLDI